MQSIFLSDPAGFIQLGIRNAELRATGKKFSDPAHPPFRKFFSITMPKGLIEIGAKSPEGIKRWKASAFKFFSTVGGNCLSMVGGDADYLSSLEKFLIEERAGRTSFKRKRAAIATYRCFEKCLFPRLKGLFWWMGRKSPAGHLTGKNFKWGGRVGI